MIKMTTKDGIEMTTEDDTVEGFLNLADRVTLHNSFLELKTVSDSMSETGTGCRYDCETCARIGNLKVEILEEVDMMNDHMENINNKLAELSELVNDDDTENTFTIELTEDGVFEADFVNSDDIKTDDVKSNMDECCDCDDCDCDCESDVVAEKDIIEFLNMLLSEKLI